MNVGVILAAGDSKRFGGTVHKQYLKLNGKEVVYYSLAGMRSAKKIDEIVVVVDDAEYEAGYIAEKYSLTAVRGGDTRNRSVYNAIEYIKKNYPSCENVIFHDSVRPFFPADRFDQYIELLKDYDAVITTTAITDTLSDRDFGFCDRNGYRLLQAPEAFRFALLADKFDPDSKCSAIVNQIAFAAKICPFEENIFNFKITYPEDLFLAEQFTGKDYFRPAADRGEIDFSRLGKVLLLGGSGGIGGAAAELMKENGVEFFAPSHKILDLKNVTVESVKAALGDFSPDAIINCAAAYADDSAGLLETFDDIFSVDLKSNLVLAEYAKTLGKKVKLIVISSSSSTKGRENLTNYSAAKAALNSVVESQAETLHKKGVYINAVIPEKVYTPLIAKLHKRAISTRELLNADEVLDAVFSLATSDEYGKLMHVRKGL